MCASDSHMWVCVQQCAIEGSDNDIAVHVYLYLTQSIADALAAKPPTV